MQSAFSGGILSRIWNGKPALGLGADQRNAIMQDFAELASEHFGDYGDKDRAQAWATSQMKKLYGVSNGVLMKYPPERTYPDVDGKHDYVYRQAADDIKAATGAEIDPKSIYLMPIPTLTAQAFRTGQPTPYALHYVEKVNDQPMHKVIHGKAFVADPAPEQAKLSAQRKAQYEAERERRENPTIADVGLPQPGDPNPKYEPATDQCRSLISIRSSSRFAQRSAVPISSIRPLRRTRKPPKRSRTKRRFSSQARHSVKGILSLLRSRARR